MFSSPCHHRDGVLIGSHDGRVHFVRTEDGRVRWTSSRLDSEVYATPFTADGIVAYVCTVRGKLYALSVDDGSTLNVFSLPNDVFSSPVVVRGKLVVGCRDDHLYCINVT